MDYTFTILSISKKVNTILLAWPVDWQREKFTRIKRKSQNISNVVFNKYNTVQYKDFKTFKTSSRQKFLTIPYVALPIELEEFHVRFVLQIFPNIINQRKRIQYEINRFHRQRLGM